jgi:hypothetical protein
MWEGVSAANLQAESIELPKPAKDVSDGSHSEVVPARERLRGVRQMHAKQRQQDQLDRAGFSQDKKDA